MLLLPAALLLGLGLGRLSGGSFGSLLTLRWRCLYLVLFGLAAQLALSQFTLEQHVAEPVRIGVILASDLLVGCFLVLAGRHVATAVRYGIALIGLGWFSNLLPTIAFGGMPVLKSSLRAAGLTGVAVQRGHFGKHLVLPNRTHLFGIKLDLSFLADDIPVRLFAAVISPGDIAMAAGIALVVAAAMHQQASVDQSLPASATRPRKTRVRGSSGSEKTFSGGPSSTMTPPSR